MHEKRQRRMLRRVACLWGASREKRRSGYLEAVEGAGHATCCRPSTCLNQTAKWFQLPTIWSTTTFIPKICRPQS